MHIPGDHTSDNLTSLLDAMGGETLDESGFENETPEPDFDLEAPQTSSVWEVRE